jgi:hypothetical protein
MFSHNPAQSGQLSNTRPNSSSQLPTSRGNVILNVEPAYQAFVQNIHGLFPELYRLIGGWVRSYCANIDARQMLLITASNTYTHLLSCYTPLSSQQAASYIDVHLKEDIFRPCLVSRLLISHFTRTLWTAGTGWLGYNQQTDVALAGINQEIGRLRKFPCGVVLPIHSDSLTRLQT